METQQLQKVESVVVIGLGAMGLPMAGHLVNGGLKVWGYDVNPEALSKAADLGVYGCTSLQEIAGQVDGVLIMVQSDQQVDNIIRHSGLVQAMKPESVICVASSTSPYTCRELAEFTDAHGIGLLDTPVVLGQEACNNGTLTVFVGGEERWLEKAMPMLTAFGKHVIHVGDVGAGQIAKTANNMLLWACMTANFEVLTLAKSLGMDVQRLVDALAYSSGANWSLSRWGKSTGKWSEKDMDVALDLAQQVKTPVPLSGLVDQLVKNINQEKNACTFILINT
ncbi:NAD(P)-dependent oxidoreductase [Cohnella kolymensis]|uniref:NAD(P)-dependent oxidoreductase n=1 Tax=Cohnella kolymensis TaxID=1590652 RepID=UPI000695CC4B|nr:NAD(P)-dependent oxidoreductase [Cohnella kolymensis]